MERWSAQMSEEDRRKARGLRFEHGGGLGIGQAERRLRWTKEREFQIQGGVKAVLQSIST